MRRIFIALSIFFLLSSLNTLSEAQDKKSKGQQLTKLVSDELLLEGKKLDEQIHEININLQNVIVKYKLMSVRDIKFIPYRVKYRLGDNYIELSQYDLKRESLFEDKLVGIKERRVRIYVDGDRLSKIESEIRDKDVGKAGGEVVKIVDPTPDEKGTDDIVFTHTINNRVIIDNKKLGEIKNNRAYPVRNDIKREFLIPHNTFVYDIVLKIAELYYEVLKDKDDSMADFLKKTSRY